MAIPSTVIDYLEKKGISYEIRQHPHSGTSAMSAISADVSLASVAKAVAFRDEQGDLLAVVPSDRDVDVKILREELNRDLQMLEESDLGALFPDCEVGAVPAIGPAYGLETVVDTRLREEKEVWFEAGDHEELIHISEPDFEALLEGAKFLSFNREFF